MPTPNNNTGGATTQAANETPIDQTKEYGGADLLDAGWCAITRGWKIFPCNGNKEPLVRWSLAATTDPATITAWAKQWPGALWGRALPADILVIDLDQKRGKRGIQEFEQLQGCRPREFGAPLVATATGGNHVYTNATGRDFKNSRSEIAPGIDTRTNGGFVVIPSGPQSGYRWLSNLNGALPPAPPWTEVTLRGTSNLGFSAEAKDYQGYSQYGDAMLASACEAIKIAPDGTQEATLNDRSYQIGRFVGGGLLDPTLRSKS